MGDRDLYIVDNTGRFQLDIYVILVVINRKDWKLTRARLKDSNNFTFISRRKLQNDIWSSTAGNNKEKNKDNHDSNIIDYWLL
jgi:hypothetical protein